MEEKRMITVTVDGERYSYHFNRNDVSDLTNFDALIVGAGYAGAVSARRLAGARGRKTARPWFYGRGPPRGCPGAGWRSPGAGSASTG